jgi:hypothetical protein
VVVHDDRHRGDPAVYAFRDADDGRIKANNCFLESTGGGPLYHHAHTYFPFGYHPFDGGSVWTRTVELE